MSKPYILCAAIHYEDLKHYDHQPENIETGYVLCGRIHTNVIASAAIAIKSGQIKAKDVDVQILCGEDLY